MQGNNKMNQDLSQYAMADSSEAERESQQQFGPREPRKVFVKRKDDTRFWKPNLNNPKKDYQAMVRILPRDRGGKLSFFVRQDMHFVKDAANKIIFACKCRGTIGAKDCPVCQYAYKFKNHNNDPMMKKQWDTYKNSTKFICNILVINDLVEPKHNGQVLLWEHTPAMGKYINAPLVTGVQMTEPAFGQEPELIKFRPYDLLNGRNLIVHMNVDPKNGFASYASSFWDKQASSIAPDANTIEQILSGVNDLSEFINDVDTVDVLTSKFQEHLNRVGGVSSAPAAGGFSAPAFGGTPAPFAGGFAQSAPAFPVTTAPVTSSPAPVAGFNTAGFQQPVAGNSAAYFGNNQPNPALSRQQFPAAPEAEYDTSSGDDLPF